MWNLYTGILPVVTLPTLVRPSSFPCLRSQCNTLLRATDIQPWEPKVHPTPNGHTPWGSPDKREMDQKIQIY